MTSSTPIVEKRSALNICYWLYKEPNQLYKVEFAYWATAKQGSNGGVVIDTKIAVSLKIPSFPLPPNAVDEDIQWDTKYGFDLPDTELALTQLAEGLEPLRESFYKNNDVQTKLKENFPILATFYDDLVLSKAAPNPLPTVIGPKRL